MKKAVKKYLIPHAGNDYKPHLLRPRTVAFVCLVVIVAESAFLYGSTYITPRSKLFGIVVTNALVDGTNQTRESNKLNTLRENPLLDAAAQAKANDMATKNYFAHTSPQGLTPWYWFEQAGYHFNYAGENLAVNFSDSQDVTNAWMNSPGHRANILNANYTDIGMATAQGLFQGHPATYVVELFGKEASATPLAIPGVSTAQASSPVKPAPKPTKPVTSTTPTVVNEISVAVKGEATNTAAIAPIPGLSITNTPSVPASNALQRILADPKTLANDFYLFIMILFGVALILNVFINIRVQHPKLIFGALAVVVVAGLCVMLNQSVAAHIAIL